MREVLFALIPGLLLRMIDLGPGPLLGVLTGILSALLFEGLFMMLRQRPLRPSLGDGSAALTGALIGLSISPLSPWWVVTLASGFAIVFGKQLYGGLGHNPFNPAMVGYTAVLISFPSYTTNWPLPVSDWPSNWGFMPALTAFFQGLGAADLDAIVGATPLGQQHDRLHGVETLRPEGSTQFMENIGFLLGGGILAYRRAIDLRISLGFLLSLFGGAAIMGLGNGPTLLSPWAELFAGSTMLGAFFIVTDPVSAPISPLGRWLHGAGIGAIAVLIRLLGSYPDGTAFAVLIMNFIAPTLDHLALHLKGMRGNQA